MEETFLQLFPKNYREKWNSLSGQVSKIREIRLRAGGPIIVHLMDGERYLGESGLTKVLRNAYKVDEQELNRYLNHFCQDSIYAFQEEIKQGYITLPGGHRVGVAGQAVVENGTVVGMKNIGFLNIRLSHQVKGAADAVLPYVYDKKQVHIRYVCVARLHSRHVVSVGTCPRVGS
jgi:stage III sporulation protein AA